MNTTIIRPCSPNTKLSYFLNAVISARMETGLRSNTLELDEDVNVYLAGMMIRFAEGRAMLGRNPYNVMKESEIIAAQESRKDIRERYWLYKENAEAILFNITIMGGIEKDLTGAKSWMALGEDVYLARCRSYFAMAASYARQTAKKEYAIAVAMEKIVENFTVYLNILYHIRDHYFRFEDKFTDGEWFHFVHKNIIHKPGVDSKVYVQLMDSFLEKLSLWKKTHANEDRDLLRIMAAELKRLNPEFTYDIESLFAACSHVCAA
ncbi:MAG: hypothetical protein JNL74_08715 [Fibrobacteres bacterium]|nr:hypothetical protein [Fibrobacterota bacterium]